MVAETLDGEALIVHLASGSYYSCRGCGETAWALLLSGRSVAETSASMALAFSTEPGAVTRDIQRFLDEAVAEGLLVESDSAESMGEPATLQGSTDYAPPMLEKYTDMQELLALDPVHDVDAKEGWPTVPQAMPGKAM